jgi:hypothetical protein
MAWPYAAHKTYVDGETLTASDLNATDVNHINNNIPESSDDYSANTTEARTTSDPDLDGSGNLATTTAEEFEGLRHQLERLSKLLVGGTYWYNLVGTSQILAPAGTAPATPPYGFNGEAGKGMYSLGTAGFGFAVGSAAVGNFDANGDFNLPNNLAVTGTSSPGTIDNLTVAGTAAITGAVTLSSTLSVGTADITRVEHTGGVDIEGTNTNDSASAGDVGEYIETKSSTLTNFPPTGTYDDAGFISLTAGDWDVTFMVDSYFNSATWTAIQVGIGTTSGNSSAGLVRGENWLFGSWASSSTTPEGVATTVANYRVSIASTTSYYGKVRSNYSSGNPQYTFRLSARRVR